MAKIADVQEVSLEKLRPYERNAKKHSAGQIEKLKASIIEFGFLTPCLIDSEYNLIAGHGRVMAAKELGIETVPCVFIEGLTDEQRRAYILADNRLGELGEWDIDIVVGELIELDELGFDVELTGFDMPEELPEVIEDDFDESAVPDEPRTKLGDIWQLGDHRLICGDSTDVNVIDRLMDGVKADCVFTDPPYQLDTQGGGILKSANSMKQIKQNGVDSFDPSRLTMWSDTNIFCHNKPLIKAYIELAENNNMSYDLAFYKKKNTVPNYKGHLMTDVEYIAIIGKQDPNKGLDKEMYSKCFIGQKDNDNELSYSKPVALCAKYILLYSKKTVLELFGGSGSTLIACEQLNRKCYMCELDPHYCDVIIQRWENLTGGKGMRINDAG